MGNIREINVSRKFNYKYFLVRLNCDTTTFEINADSVFIQSLIDDYPEINNLITTDEKNRRIYAGKEPVSMIPRDILTIDTIPALEDGRSFFIHLKKKDENTFITKIERIPIVGKLNFID